MKSFLKLSLNITDNHNNVNFFHANREFGTLEMGKLN